jgi:hypothetical protein
MLNRYLGGEAMVKKVGLMLAVAIAASMLERPIGGVPSLAKELTVFPASSTRALARGSCSEQKADSGCTAWTWGNKSCNCTLTGTCVENDLP